MKKDDSTYSWPEPKICPVCGKEFTPAVLHTYKIFKDERLQKVCSYKCARKWEKKGGRARGC